MGRQIDFNQPLSEDEAAYVRDRPWLLVDAELNGIEVVFADESFATESEEDETDADNAEDDSDDEEADDEDDENDEEDDSDEEDDDEEPSDNYDEFELPALKDVAEERGISKSGSKKQIIARLRQQDSE